jgi:TRAP-type C4-dicarboxylate transport system permease small subunit
MNTLEKLIARLTLGIGSVLLVLMVVQIVIDVLMRSTMGAGFPATSELVSKYYMVAVSFLPIAYAELRRRHIEASIFTDYLGPRGKLVVLLFGYVLSLLVYTALTWGTAVEALLNTEKGAYVETGTAIFYTWPSYWILPFSFALMSIVLLMRVISGFAELIQNRISAHSTDILNVTLAHNEE